MAATHKQILLYLFCFHNNPNMGFDRGFEPERILGITEFGGYMCF